MRNLSGPRFARGALAIVCLVIGAPTLLAQTGAIVGRVIDGRLNAPVAQATIEIEGSRLGATTGQDGRFRVTNVPAGARAVIARRIGFGVVRKPVTVPTSGEVTVDFTLEAAAVSLDEVVVTGTAGVELRRSVGADARSPREPDRGPDREHRVLPGR